MPVWIILHSSNCIILLSPNKFLAMNPYMIELYDNEQDI